MKLSEILLKTKLLILLFALFPLSGFSQVNTENRVYQLWDDQAAQNRGADYNVVKSRGYPYDIDWERESYPIGNGYMGACIFGRTDVERIQITEKTLANEGLYGKGGLTNFAEIYLNINHHNPKNYKRSLNLNEGILKVSYEQDGVNFKREYFANYPENIIVVRIDADQKAKVSFGIDFEIPDRRSINENNTRTGTVNAQDDLITLSGKIAHFNVNYEAQVKVINEGGELTSINTSRGSSIHVKDADSVVLLIAAGTNYKLSPKVFLEPVNNEKLDVSVYPHEKVSNRIKNASNLGFDDLKSSHIQDFKNLSERVELRLSDEVPQIPTRLLLEEYKEGKPHLYLEELMFHFGRYILISSSREGALPCGLQGVWSQYHVTPWTGGYWHNINLQMNYWGAFSTNLVEVFTPYLEYYKAYRPKTEEHAKDYILKNNPAALSEDGENGWAIGTGATAYIIGAPGGHSGPGTGGFTGKLFWDRYEYTMDTQYLREVAYPALLSMSQFLSKTLKPSENNTLLVEPSASPEIRLINENGRFRGPHYVTKGTTFDQGFVWEVYNDVLKAADIIEADDEFLEIIRDQIDRLDPIIIGGSGQIKEYREENFYGEIGDPHHRHVSHLCPLYPGTLINSSTPDWLQAVSVSLDYRGNDTTGWALAHRMNLRARTKEADKAYEVYSKFIKERTCPNLWAFHPPFQVDGSLGTMAGVAEMLVQSHEGFIELLPALPEVWHTGEFSGLLARGNFELSATWKNGKAVALKIISKNGGKCILKYQDIESIQIQDVKGHVVECTKTENGMIAFETEKSAIYFVTF